ncbi:MAG: hypothetical protein COV70_01045 [Parcubacteria group bacterium CG11_big_fil_rev_8_21_14_0_20_39_22]|nr:MAG: hypothetical protein COV70_01045 [Parcubacteria group bacterium CG11_big_fil_rev_8_21_14_0_20_39_22]
MKTYFSTFITGTQEIVKEFLAKRGVKIKLLLDGLVVYESDYPEREIRNFHIFNNTYLLLRSFSNLAPDAKSLEKILAMVSHDKNLQHQIAINLPSRKRNFKIVSSLENSMVPVSRELLQKLESIILRTPGTRLNIQKPDLEFWALLRRERYGFFGIRVTYPFRHENYREKGELRKEISYILSFLSKPNPKDVVLDPFAGYGSIPIERAASFPYKEIIAVEKEDDLISKLKQKVKASGKKIEVIRGNALALSGIQNKSIDKIISDPPWGEYKEVPDLEKFYESLLLEFDRILKKEGVIVLLIGAKDIFENILQNKFTNIFQLQKKYDILVSGKKAAIYKLVRNYENK